MSDPFQICCPKAAAARSPQRARQSRSRALLASAAVLLALAGCVPRNTSGSRAALPALGSQEDVVRASAYWGDRFSANPGDERAAYAYSRALAAQDQRAQAVAVLQKAVLANSSSAFLKGELGKALAANGQFNEALSVLAEAHSRDRPDWRVLSAQGAVYDQIGQPDTAREHYRAALQIAPNEPSILSNLGLSYALSGDLPAAETYLRQADANGKADERARQNLAIVVGLQGRFQEAEAIARRDLPADQAEKNIALLRSMLAQADTWDRIRNGGKPATRTVASGRGSAAQSGTSDATGSIPPSTVQGNKRAETPVNLLKP